MTDPTILAAPTPGRAETLTLRSPLATMHANHGAITDVEGGAELSRSFGDPDAERAAIAGAVGLADLSVRAKIDLRGVVDEAYVPADGDVLARIADGWALVLAPPGPVADRVASMAARTGSRTMVTDATHLLAGMALAGPLMSEAVARLSSWDPATLPRGSATGVPIADVRAIVVRRDTAVPVLEAYVAMEFARYAWRSVLEVVGRLGGRPVGWDALRAEGWR